MCQGNDALGRDSGALREAQMYVDSVGVLLVSYAMRRAKLILFDTYNKKTKRRKKQIRIMEYMGTS